MSSPSDSPKPRPGKAAKQDKKTPRGLVCPACGKYHDVTDRSEGSDFDCKCGRRLHVLTRAERIDPTVAARERKVQELAKSCRRAAIGATVAFVASIALFSAVIYLAVTKRLVAESICAGVMALGFLIAATIASSEVRRLKSELAAERIGNEVSP